MKFKEGHKINNGRKQTLEHIKNKSNSCKGFKHSEKTKEKMSKMRKGIEPWNKGLTKETDERVKQNGISNSITLKKQWKNLDFKEEKLKKMMSSNSKPNGSEKKVIEIIKKHSLPFDYVGNGKFWIRGNGRFFNPDFYSKKYNAIIEVFGLYWHNNNNIMEKDRDMVCAYTIQRYKLLIIYEDKINEDKIINWIKKLT